MPEEEEAPLPLDPRRDGLPPDPVLPAAALSLITLAAFLALLVAGLLLR